MELILSSTRFMILLLLATITLSDCYDPLDPNGNITVTFDIHDYKHGGYMARVTIQNYYLYRHVEAPGWKLTWTWPKTEVIWSMSGAFATQQGNCSSLYKGQTPHSCIKTPSILDLMPDAPPENKTKNCCRGGVLPARAINPAESITSFEMVVGNLGSVRSSYKPPFNLRFMGPGPGYTCGSVQDVEPTKSLVVNGRREIQVFRTWKSMCTYSSFVAKKMPVCCVSLSTFYNPVIARCPECSCGCRVADQRTAACISSNDGYPLTRWSSINDVDVVQCTDHMCPVRVHWHIKKNYMTHWRVKLTISNYNYKRNYSNWNLLVQHPGFGQSSVTYSFNNTLLPTDGFTDEIALFWGLNYYNKELLNADSNEVGSVTTDIILKKDSDSFTLKNGWGFPRKLYFNGEECQMPPPDYFPILPNHSFNNSSSYLLLIIFVTLQILLTFS